jgi:hypothetical protein
MTTGRINQVTVLKAGRRSTASASVGFTRSGSASLPHMTHRPVVRRPRIHIPSTSATPQKGSGPKGHSFPWAPTEGVDWTATASFVPPTHQNQPDTGPRTHQTATPDTGQSRVGQSGRTLRQKAQASQAQSPSKAGQRGQQRAPQQASKRAGRPDNPTLMSVRWVTHHWAPLLSTKLSGLRIQDAAHQQNTANCRHRMWRAPHQAQTPDLDSRHLQQHASHRSALLRESPSTVCRQQFILPYICSTTL